jgi:uroporphyrinogen-III synthase
LLLAGLAPQQIEMPGADAPQFDSEALWLRVGAQVRPGQRVLIVRGADAQGMEAGRDWLGEQLRRAGVQVDRVLAYQRGVPVWSHAQLARAGAAVNDGTVWLFSSSEAIANLLDRLPGRDWSAARAVATHPRIAASARRAGFGVVCESRPTLEAVMSSIKSSG